MTSMLFTAGSFAQDHHWPLNADVNDVVGSKNGTEHNITYVNDTERGDVAVFNGIDAFADIPTLLNGKSEITISIWYNPDFIQEWRCLYALGKSEAEHFRIMPSNGAEQRMELITHSPGQTTWPGAWPGMTQGVWHHSVVTFTPTRMTFYHDGNKLFEQNTLRNVFTFDDILNFIGKNQLGGQDFFKGKMSDMKVYYSVKTDKEVSELYVAENKSTSEIVSGFSIDNITTNSADLHLSLKESGTVHAIWKLASDPAPSIDDIKASAIAAPVDTYFKYPLGNLDSKTKYTAYLLAKDASNNWQSNYTAISIKTLEDPTLVYHWPLAGNITEVNNGLDATLVGATFENDAVRGQVAKLSNGYIELPSVIHDLDETTVAMWFRMDSELLWAKLISLGVGESGGAGHREGVILTIAGDWDGSHPLGLDMTNYVGDWNGPKANPTINLGTWHHIAMSYTGEIAKLYFDGIELFSATLPEPIGKYNDTENCIGKSYWGDPIFDGAVSDLQIFTKKLSSEEINKVMNGESLGAKELAKTEASIKIYPNPAKNSVTLSAKEFNSVEIYNALGQSVLKLDGKKDLEINTTKFESGIYIVKFTNNETSIAKRLVIK